MADFGDDVGDMLIRHTDDFIRRLIQYRQKAAKGQNETESKSSSITIQGENEAAAVAKALTDKGIPFEITRTSLNVEQNGELGSRFQLRRPWRCFRQTFLRLHDPARLRNLLQIPHWRFPQS